MQLVSLAARLAQRIDARNPGAEPGSGRIDLAKGEPGKHALLLLRALAWRFSPAMRQTFEMNRAFIETMMRAGNALSNLETDSLGHGPPLSDN